MEDNGLRNIVKMVALFTPIGICATYVLTILLNYHYANEVIKVLSDNKAISNDTILMLATELKELIPSTVSVGIAIIAVAVAVWIGLNIYNLANKNDIDTLHNTVQELSTMLSVQEQRFLAMDVSENYRKENIYIRMIQLDPLNWMNYNLLGNFYYKLGEKDKAMDMYEDAIEKAECQGIKYCNAHYNKAIVMRNRGEYKKALKEFLRLQAYAKKDFEITLNIEELYMIVGRYTSDTNEQAECYAKAEEYLKKLKRLIPDNCYLYNDMGIWHCLKNNRDKAIENFIKALERQPDLPETKHYLSLLCVKQTTAYESEDDLQLKKVLEQNNYKAPKNGKQIYDKYFN